MYLGDVRVVFSGCSDESVAPVASDERLHHFETQERRLEKHGKTFFFIHNSFVAGSIFYASIAGSVGVRTSWLNQVSFVDDDDYWS